MPHFLSFSIFSPFAITNASYFTFSLVCISYICSSTGFPATPLSRSEFSAILHETFQFPNPDFKLRVLHRVASCCPKNKDSTYFLPAQAPLIKLEMLPVFFFLTFQYYACWQGIGKGMFNLINWYKSKFYEKEVFPIDVHKTWMLNSWGADTHFDFAACLIILISGFSSW